MNGESKKLIGLDIVGNVGWNKMNEWCKFYKDVLGFSQIISFDDKDISTEYTALMSKVMSSGNGRVKFPINEPAEGINKSRIEEYLDFLSIHQLSLYYFSSKLFFFKYNSYCK